MGGIASGKARRKKASLIRSAQTILEADMPKKVKSSIEKLAGTVEDENDSLFTAATAVMVKEALDGNVQAYRELLKAVDMIESSVRIDDSIDDDAMSASLEEFAAGEIDGDI